jgi:hypothetical protein
MDWCLTNRADLVAASIADRHYTRQSVGARQFVPPGRCVVLLTADASALWVSSWPKSEYVRHAWAGAWMCSLFRNESPGRYLSSDLISQAVAATRAVWGKLPPQQGFVTFVDASQVRTKRDPGRCFLRAGWHYAGYTKGGLVVLQLLPSEMPSALAPSGFKSLAFRDTFCLFCEKRLEQKDSGRLRKYCNDVCRQNACRARKALYK